MVNTKHYIVKASFFFHSSNVLINFFSSITSEELLRFSVLIKFTTTITTISQPLTKQNKQQPCNNLILNSYRCNFNKVNSKIESSVAQFSLTQSRLKPNIINDRYLVCRQGNLSSHRLYSCHMSHLH